MFSLRIFNKFCVPGTSDSCFPLGFLMNSALWQQSASSGPSGFEDAAHQLRGVKYVLEAPCNSRRLRALDLVQNILTNVPLVLLRASRNNMSWVGRVV